MALYPKRIEESVSAKLFLAGDKVMMTHVFELPPSEFCNTRVSFESRYGTYGCFFTRARMTMPRVERDLLIDFASSRVFPLAPVLLTCSDPAKSTRCSLPIFLVPSSWFAIATVSVKRECERDEASFILVAATVRFLLPFYITL
jgi:hypothetical protein